MNRKRLIKKLMGEGIGRNDAAAFARVRSRLKASGQLGKLLPEMELPEVPLPRMDMIDIQVQTLRAEYVIPWCERCGELPKSMRERVHKHLVQLLADKLMKDAIVRYREVAETDSVKIRAEVRVLPPLQNRRNDGT